MGLVLESLHPTPELLHVLRQIVEGGPGHEVEAGPGVVERLLSPFHGGPHGLPGPILGELPSIDHVVEGLLDGVLQRAQDPETRLDPLPDLVAEIALSSVVAHGVSCEP